MVLNRCLLVGVCSWFGCSSSPEAPARGAGQSGSSETADGTSTPSAAVAASGIGGSLSDVEPTSTGAPTMDEDCDSILEVTYRDFDETHPDMERDNPGDVVRHNLVELELGSDKKPVFASSVGCPRVMERPSQPGECDNWTVTEPVIESPESFDQWYRTVDGVNLEIEKTLELTATGTGDYVFDSTSFFPLAPSEGFGIAPTPDHHLMSNFLFTTEIHVRFRYVSGQVFTFRGDDDLWIFVNDKLAMDLGSMHAAEVGTIDFDAQASELGIVAGQSYDMDIFHAERHTLESNFRFETNISCFEPVVIK